MGLGSLHIQSQNVNMRNFIDVYKRIDGLKIGLNNICHL